MSKLCNVKIFLCIFRFGSCQPFIIHERGTPCDILYTPGVDSIYVSGQRKRGNIYSYMDIFEDIAAIVFSVFPEKCHDPAIQVLCHYFLPPCGNRTVFEAPTSVCTKTCNFLHKICPSAWEKVMAYFETNSFWLRRSGLTFINCSNTGQYLDPVPHCCSDIDVGVDIRTLCSISCSVCSQLLLHIQSSIENP